jgi:hypothetical protein
VLRAGVVESRSTVDAQAPLAGDATHHARDAVRCQSAATGGFSTGMKSTTSATQASDMKRVTSTAESGTDNCFWAT